MASFELYTADLHLCPLSWGGRAISLAPCALLGAGVLRARGSATLNPQTELRPWLLVGVSALLDISLTRRMVLSGNAGLGRPLVRDQFRFDPVVFHRVPLWAANGGISLAWVF